MNNKKLEEFLAISPVVPVVVIDDAEDALPLAKALLEGGIRIIEITLRTSAALDAIKIIANELPEICVGAGTVNSVNAIQNAANAGAKFLVSPGATKTLLDSAHYHDVPLLPGAITPSEAMTLQEQGYTILKFFPAEAAGGTKMLKSLSGPLPDIKFCPTGGINASNIKEYLTIKNVICAGSSWITESDLIKNKNWSEITRRAREVLAMLEK